MEEVFEFYDAHNGKRKYGQGVAIGALPKSLTNILKELDGQKISLKSAMEKIIPITKNLGGKIEIMNENKFILFSFGPYTYNLINYK